MRGRLVALLVLAFAAPPAYAVDISLRSKRMRTPRTRNTHYLAALRLDIRGDHGAAAVLYARAAQEARSKRAQFQRKMSASIVQLIEALRKSPDSYDHHFNLGVNLQNKYWALHLDLGKRSNRLYQMAEHHFRRAIQLRRTAANPVICLAALYAQAGSRARAQETMTKEMSGRKVLSSDVYNLAFYEKMMGNMDKAFEHLKKAFRHDSRHREWVLESDDFVEYLGDPRLKALLRDPHSASRSRRYKFKSFSLRPWLRRGHSLRKWLRRRAFRLLRPHPHP